MGRALIILILAVLTSAITATFRSQEAALLGEACRLLQRKRYERGHFDGVISQHREAQV